MTTPVRLAYVVSHPIQYQAPLLRRLAREPDIDLHVFFGSDFSLRGYKDTGFGVEVKWDVPLLDGYKSEFLPRLRDKGTHNFFDTVNYGLRARLAGRNGVPPFDLLWIHGYSSATAQQAMFAAKSLGIPVVVRSDSTLFYISRGPLKRLVKRAFFAALRRMIDGVFITGTHNQEYWTHYLGNSLPMFHTPHAVDNAFFQQRCREARATRAELQGELNLDPTRPVILFVAKLQPRKRGAELIKAYTRLSVDGRDPHPYLIMVGDGQERAALDAQAAATGFSSIRLCGFRNQSEIPRFFDLATVFVHPGTVEPWGLIVNEAMNAALPIAISDEVGCQPDLVRDGIEGYVFHTGDLDALEAALRRILASPDETAAMGQRALDRINHWSFEEDVKGIRQALAHFTGKIQP
jgi:glycosyltransferase involved in cell wall biosynthesis